MNLIFILTKIVGTLGTVPVKIVEILKTAEIAAFVISL